jgi:adenylate cyclase
MEEKSSNIRNEIIENQKIIDALNDKLSRKVQEVRVIQEVSSEINSTLDLNEILQKILKSMDEILGFKHSMILLLGQEGDKLILSASRGYKQAGIGAEVKVGQGIIGIVAKRKRIVRMGNIRSQLSYMSSVRNSMAGTGDSGTTNIVKLPGLENADSQIGIPLLIKDKLVGVFSVEDTKPNAFDELDEILLMILANQAASVIDNARLYKAEIERAEELNRAYTQLRDLNEQLEQKVQNRTEELSAALEEVDKERNRSMELLERMVPPQVIPLMLEDKLMARRYHATILFTDLQGFTDYTSNMEPDEIFSQLNHFFSFAGEHIETYRGYVNKTIGDSVMALFGVPTPSATHPIDAVLAGLKMQSGIRQHFRLNMRIGINSGTISAGLLGPQNKNVYDVLGDTVNLASRMESVCKPGSVTISEETAKWVEPYFVLSPNEEREIKGIGMTKTYEVLGLLKLENDRRRLDETSLFFQKYRDTIQEVESIKEEHFDVVDFTSIQARDGALLHNEAVAAFSLALFRYLRSEDTSPSPEITALRSQLNEISETDLVSFALLHDLGKYSVEHEKLNDTSLEKEERLSLIRLLCENTKEALRQLELEHFIPQLERFYDYEMTKGAVKDIDAFTLIVAIADIFDALTAPKMYKGKSWSIQGTLEEILRNPYAQLQKSPIIRDFVELMRPASEEVKASKKTKKLFK